MIPRPPRSTRTVPLFPDPTLSPALAAAAAAAESITAAAEAAILKATAEIVATAETVALVPAAPAAITAASFVETHALLVFPTSPKFTINNPSVGRQPQDFGSYSPETHFPAFPTRRIPENKFPQNQPRFRP